MARRREIPRVATGTIRRIHQFHDVARESGSLSATARIGYGMDKGQATNLAENASWFPGASARPAVGCAAWVAVEPLAGDSAILWDGSNFRMPISVWWALAALAVEATMWSSSCGYGGRRLEFAEFRNRGYVAGRARRRPPLLRWPASNLARIPRAPAHGMAHRRRPGRGPGRRVHS